MKKFWRKSGDDDYICELREKKTTQNCLPRAMEDWESPVQHEEEQNRTEKGKKKECLQISNFDKRG